MILGVVASTIGPKLTYDALNTTENADFLNTAPIDTAILSYREFNGYSAMIYDTGDVLHKYDTTAEQNIDAITNQSDSIALASTAQDFSISPDGTKIMYISNDTTLFARTMSTADDLSTAGSATSGDWPTSVGGLTLTESRALVFASDGLRYWILDLSEAAVVEFTLSTAWDPTSTHTYVGHIVLTDDAASATLPRGMDFSPDGKKLIILDNQQDYIHEYTLATPFSVVNGHTYNGSDDWSLPLTAPQSCTYNADGSSILVTDSSQDKILQFDTGEIERLGPETLDDPEFDTPAEWENANGYFTVTGGQAVHDGTGTDYVREAGGSLYTINERYKIVYDVAANTGVGANNVYFGDSAEVVSNANMQPGIVTYRHTLTQTKANLVTYGRSTAAITLNSVSCKQILNPLQF